MVTCGPARIKASGWASCGQGAAIFGADKAVHLGYADSGHEPVLFEDPPGRTRFVRGDVAEAARKLAALLTEGHADLLLSYDPKAATAIATKSRYTGRA
jgi:hypothetical protein